MNQPNTIESVQPLSGGYSLKKDLRLNAWFMVAAAVFLIVRVLRLQHPEWSPLARALLTMAPLLPGMLYVRSCVRFARGLDELQRRIQVESWLFAALGSLFVSAVINTFNANGIEVDGIRHGLGVAGTFAMTFALWVVSGAIVNRNYK
jgi:hypothetical protein